MKLAIALAFLSGLAVANLPLPVWLTEPEPACTSDDAGASEVSVEEMLEAFVADYRSDPMARGPMTFGVLVKGAEDPEWHVVISARQPGENKVDVALEIGLPREPRPYYVTDVETLARIYRGELASMTAMGKAFSTDFAPLDIELMEGFEPSENTAADMMVLSFHFWTRGFPEVVRFGDPGAMREMHGASGVLFYYQPGFRSGWFRVHEGQHVNADVRSQTNPFPTLIVCTEGVLRAKIGGVERDVTAGEAVFIGPDVAHEFWVTGSEPAGGVLLMFGEGA